MVHLNPAQHEGGGAEVVATVTMSASDGTTVLGTAVADGSGNWSITSSALLDGVHNLTAKQTDIAGNISLASAALSVTIDTTSPAAPSVPDLTRSEARRVGKECRERV